ncbi:AI-2E family transporter [Geobacter sp. SVR]|uniref:AI-2E family transporter n=1 Tax=Geobacter sp. SVR TaxID=2495594 RepID=UPI00143EFDE4|nr:AI-2E family transporter [Geobacter sp. SVR]BCS52793.1 membrane protein [Geobacter sp. SVR]GCF86659.1 membrane protein [Geobacter sp. SVR]
MQGYVAISYLLAIAAVVLVLKFHLLPAVIAGLAVYVLTLKLARYLPRNMNRFAHKVALAVVALAVITGLTGAGTAIWSLIGSSHGIAALLTKVVDTLGSLRPTLPESVAEVLPTSIEGLRQQLMEMIGMHARKISAVGMESFKVVAHVLLGMVVGGMTAVHHFREHTSAPPFLGALRARLRRLTTAFDKVVFAQVKISGFNTALTALYLLVVLPLFDIHLPMAMLLVLLTFAVGLLPVLGNLVSNTVIFIISLGVSPMVAVSSLLFLIMIHKAEYFMNARIVGHEVQATAWELLIAMLLMEAMFGIGGLIAAPVIYAWTKAEVKEQGLI